MSMMHSNAAEVSVKIGALNIAAHVRARRIVKHHTMLLITRIKARAALPASGPPGPRLITGDYNASWTPEYRDTGTSFTGVAGTDRPQARRLEHGFVGADRLGRVYNQPPYPHVAPALADTEPGFLRDMRETFGDR